MEINDDVYIHIPGYAIKKLKLKDTELLVYSIIHGFSHNGQGEYWGSVSYLCALTNKNRNTIRRVIKNLVDRGLIKNIGISDRQTNKYVTVDISFIEDDENDGSLVVTNTMNIKESEKFKDVPPRESKNTSSKVNDNIIDNKEKTNSYLEKKKLNESVEEIINYYNKKNKTSFKSNNKDTIKLINSKLKIGFTVDDFKRVIDFKYKQWGENPYKFKDGRMSDTYMSPTTLFGNKFETYFQNSFKESSDEDDDSQFESVSISSPVSSFIDDCEY